MSQDAQEFQPQVERVRLQGRGGPPNTATRLLRKVLKATQRTRVLRVKARSSSSFNYNAIEESAQAALKSVWRVLLPNLHKPVT